MVAVHGLDPRALPFTRLCTNVKVQPLGLDASDVLSTTRKTNQCLTSKGAQQSVVSARTPSHAMVHSVEAICSLILECMQASAGPALVRSKAFVHHPLSHIRCSKGPPGWLVVDEFADKRALGVSWDAGGVAASYRNREEIKNKRSCAGWAINQGVLICIRSLGRGLIMCSPCL